MVSREGLKNKNDLMESMLLKRCQITKEREVAA